MFTGITQSSERTVISLKKYNLYGKAISSYKVTDYFCAQFLLIQILANFNLLHIT
jgi:hypothetical protein